MNNQWSANLEITIRRVNINLSYFTAWICASGKYPKKLTMDCAPFWASCQSHVCELKSSKIVDHMPYVSKLDAHFRHTSYCGSILGSAGVIQTNIYTKTHKMWYKTDREKKWKNETTTIGDTRWDKLPSTNKLSKSRNLIESLPGRQPNRNREHLYM